MDPEKITYFGETDSRGKRVKFGIKAKDRTRHVYVIGKTGMGKSTLLENMAIQDIQNGEGMAFIDPHGKTAQLLLNYVPPERLNDVVYFAPFDVENPISFNVLEDVGVDKRHLVVSGLMSTFKKIWLDTWSARMEYILTNTLLALIEYPGATLLGVNRMLADKEYRKKVVDNVTDVSVKSFWVDEFAKYTERQAAEAVPAIQNKIGQFTANPLIRNIVGQTKSSFDIRKIMDDRKILIINLSKGMVGETNANLLGSMMITKIYLGAMSRADVHEKNMKALPNFYLYVDEFQSFANESFADILSEARKYKLNLTIAHQYIEQMSEEVRAAVFGNAGTMITFRVGAYDAEVLEKEYAPQFTAEDLVNLGMFQMYLKLMIDGVGSTPFSASSLPPYPEPVISYQTELIENSRKNFAKQRAEVEESIKKWAEDGRVSNKSILTQKNTPTITNNPKFSQSSTTSTTQKTYTEKTEVKKVYQEPTKVVTETNPSQITNQFNVTKKVELVKPIAVNPVKIEKPKYQNNFPPMEDEKNDFVPLKALTKNLVTEPKIGQEKSETLVKKPTKTHSKAMTPENLSNLRSALDAVMKKNEKPKAETNEKSADLIANKKVTKAKSKKSQDFKDNTGEVPEEDLKKVLGI